MAPFLLKTFYAEDWILNLLNWSLIHFRFAKEFY